MTTPDSPTAAPIELEVLSRAIKRSRETAIVLNIGSVAFFVAWIVAHFFYPLPILGWLALAFFGLAHVHQIGRSLIDHHAAMNTLIPLEFQFAQAHAAQEAVAKLSGFRQEAMGQVPAATTDQSGAKVIPASAIGFSGRKVN